MRSSETDLPVARPSRQSDRRRPGRQDVSPALLPLLRGQPGPSAEADYVAVGEDGQDLAAARGICIGLLISVPLWAVIIMAVRALL
jgi:hypothetical protein